jgi:large subunit ribosomal protein L18Ae
MKLYQVVGRKAPTSNDENPPAYRMKLFAPNEVVAKSRFWYFMHQMRKMKKTTGEILDVNEIVEKNSRYVKNYGIWIKYNSRSGTHNMYREYRDISLNAAIGNLYNDMAGRHRARFASIQIIKTATVAAKDTKRVNVQQFHNSKIKFPLPHRILRASSKQFKNTFSSFRPTTFFK